MSFWDKLMSFFSGKKDKDKDQNKTLTKAQQTYGTKASESSAVAYRKSVENKRRENERVRQKQEDTTKKLKAGLSMAHSIDVKSGDTHNTQRNTSAPKRNGTQRVVSKIGEKALAPQPKQSKEYLDRQKKSANALVTKESKSKSIADDSRYNDKEYRKQAALKQVEAYENAKPLAYTDITTSKKYLGSDEETRKKMEKARDESGQAAMASAMGLKRGLTLGLSDYVDPNLQTKEGKALEKRAKEEHGLAYGAGEMAGNLATYAATGGAVSGIGKKMLGKVAPNTVERLAANKTIQSLASKVGKTSMEFAKGLADNVATDLGLFVTDDTVMSLVNAAETEGDFGDKAREFLKQQGINLGMNVGANVLGYGAKNVANKVQPAWEQFADESRRLYAVDPNVAKGIELEGAFPKVNSKSWKQGEYYTMAYGADAGSVRAVKVKGAVKEVGGRSVGITKDGNRWVATDIKTGLMISDAKSKKALTEGLEKIDFSKIDESTISNYTPKFYEAISDDMGDVGNRRRLLAEKRANAEANGEEYSTTLEDVIDNIREGKLDDDEIGFLVGEDIELERDGEFHDVITDKVIPRERLAEELEARYGLNTNMPNGAAKDINLEGTQYIGDGGKVLQGDEIDAAYNTYVKPNELDNKASEVANRRNNAQAEARDIRSKFADNDGEDFYKYASERLVELSDADIEATYEFYDTVKQMPAEDRRGYIDYMLVRPDVDDAMFELERIGNASTGGYGTIYANDDGTYNLFINGFGDTTLTKEQVEEYLTRSFRDFHMTESGLMKRAFHSEDTAKKILNRVKRAIPDTPNAPQPKVPQPKVDLNSRRTRDIALREDLGIVDANTGEILGDIPKEPTAPQPKIDRNNRRRRDVVLKNAEVEPKAEEPMGRQLPPNKEELRNKVAEMQGREPEPAKTVSDVDIAREDLERRIDYETRGEVATSKSYISALKQADSEEGEKLIRRMKEEGRFDYTKEHHRSLAQRAQRFVNDPKSFDDFVNKVKIANESEKPIFGHKEVKEAQYNAYAALELALPDIKNSKEAEDMAANLMQFIKENASQGGTTLELQRYMVMLNPEKRAEILNNDIVDMLDKSKGFRMTEDAINFSSDPSVRKAQINEHINKDEKFKGLRDVMERMKDPNLTREDVARLNTEAVLEANKLVPMTALDYLQEWRYLAMLGNPKTHIRNRLGNSLFGSIREISNSISAGIENAMVKSGKLDKNHFYEKAGFNSKAYAQARMKEPTDELGKMANNAWKENKDSLLSGGSKYEIRPNDGKIRKGMGKWLEKLSKLNSDMLEHADETAMAKRFREQFYKIADKNGLTKMKPTDKGYQLMYDRCVENASNEALEATFREYNEAAKWLNKITSNMYNANASLGKKAGAVAVNAIMPFAKTPANILKQSVRYTPEGLIEGAYKVSKAIKSGDVTLMNDAIDKLGKGLTGTGVLALGMMFGGATGCVTTFADSPDAKFKKRQGEQDYSITMNIGGQDYSFTLDWLSPISTTFFVGAEIRNQLDQMEDGGLIDFASSMGTLADRAIEPMLETSMLSGIHDAFEGMTNSYGDEDRKPISKLLTSIAQSYTSSLIPTLQGQVARAAYSSDKQLAGSNDNEYFINSLKNKAGLAGTNLFTDALGEATDSYGNIKNPRSVGKAIATMLSPANIQKVNITDGDRQLIKDYENLVKGGMAEEDAGRIFPKPNYNKTFSFGKGDNKVEVNMNGKELAVYNKARATGGRDAAEVMFSSKMFNRFDGDGMSSEQKKAAVNKRLAEREKEIAKFDGKSTQDVINYFVTTPEYKNASPEERLNVMSKIFNSSLSSGQAVGNKKTSQRAVYVAQGGKAEDYDFANDLTEKQQSAYKQYEGIISKAEAVQFAKDGNGAQLYMYEDGSTRHYFTKAQMMDYLNSRDDLTYKQKEALFNMFKQKNAKAYNGSGGSSSGRGGYGGYRRGGRRSSSSSKSVGVNKSAPKVKGLKDVKSLDSSIKKSSASLESKYQLERVKAAPPKPKY